MNKQLYKHEQITYIMKFVEAMRFYEEVTERQENEKTEIGKDEDIVP